MRKILLSILLCFACLATMHAERPRPFEVKRLRSWAPEYLTITNAYLIEYIEIYFLKDCPVKEEYIWMDIITGEHSLENGSVILSIDGRTTKDMSEQTFYNIVGQKDEHELTVCDVESGGYKRPFTIKFRIKESPYWMQQCLPYPQSQILRGENIPGLEAEALNVEKSTIDYFKPSKFAKTYWDKDFDWFSIQTYDFIPTQDPLIDKKIMEAFVAKFPRLKRDTNNPDVLIRLTKDEQQSVNSTYVPPTVQVVNEGSTTRRTYNYYGNDTYQTKQKNRVIKEGDYVETTKTEDVYLEIVMLDTKRIEQTIPPIIYQFKYKRHIVNRDWDLEDAYLYQTKVNTRDPYNMADATKYTVKSYDTRYIRNYYLVSHTGLSNSHILGGSRCLYENDHVWRETINGQTYLYILKHNGKRVSKKNRQYFKCDTYNEDKVEDSNYFLRKGYVYWFRQPDFDACVVFDIWRFAIDEE